MSLKQIETSGIERQHRRWLVRLILIVAACAQLSRLVQVQSATGETPFLSANDRSRWCTIAALAVHGSYEIDDVIEIRDPESRRRTWYTIDLVQHRASDGKQHFYSSKPPLLPTILAGVYLAIRATTGATLMDDPFLVASVLLAIVNWVPLVAFWFLIARWIEQEDLDLWSSVVLACFLGWGTYLTTFVNTLNNHLPAAFAVGLSLWCIYQVALKDDRRAWLFALCGICTSFGASNELPALSWVAAAGAILFFVDPKRTLVFYATSLLPVALAFFAANYAAHGVWKPAYAHRSLGEKLGQVQIEAGQALESLPVAALRASLEELDIHASSASMIRAARRAGYVEFWDPETQLRLGVKPDTSDPSVLGIYVWDDWYDYPNSYWTDDRKQGVDRGEPSRSLYIFHCLFGHHGIISLTPFWLVAIWGGVVVWRRRVAYNIFRDRQLLITAAIAATTLVSIGFYLARPLEDRNYGGVSSGFRWSFWLIPLWLWWVMRALPAIQHPIARRLVVVLLAISVFSSCFPWHNPWTSPWLMQLFEYLRLI
ncbi:MAG: hypothetical protein KDB22_04020 [Planctomycetales bacterium]|nr:hypothetical protein [Planctomycetales bacterium]